MSLAQTMALLRYYQSQADQEGDQLRQAVGQPVNRQVANPGQRARDVLTNPDQNQARAMLAASLELAGHDPRHMPMQTVNRAITRGFDTLDQSRMADREQKIQQHGLGYQQATNARDTARQQADLITKMKPTRSIQEYQYAVDQGYQGSYEDWVKDHGKGGVNINMGPQMGSLPMGYALKYTEQGQPSHLERLPGHPDEQAEAEAGEKAARSRANQASIAGFTLRDARYVQAQIGDLHASAPVRVLRARFPGTAEFEVQSSIDSLRGTIGIEQLLNIKREGSGLGQVPQSQLNMLASLMGQLDIGLSKGRLSELVSDIQGRYLEILDLIPEEERAMIGIAEREYRDLLDLWSGDGPGESVGADFVDDLALPEEQKALVREALQRATQRGGNP